MIVSIHRYELAEEATDQQFRDAVAEARRRDLFDLPGLVDYRFLYGLRGAREGRYAAVWTYESRAAWRNLWGPVDDPVSRTEYPEPWKTWEDELLAPVVAGDPDDVAYTAHEVVESSAGE